MLLFRLNVTSKKSTCFKFVLISILNPISLKIFMISFLVLSVCGPVRFRTIAWKIWHGPVRFRTIAWKIWPKSSENTTKASLTQREYLRPHATAEGNVIAPSAEIALPAVSFTKPSPRPQTMKKRSTWD